MGKVVGKGEEAFNIKVFGDLEVIEKGKKGRSVCLCSCGKEKIISARYLLDGTITHCGCKKDKRTKSMIEVDDMVNNKDRKDMLLAVGRDDAKTTRAKAFVKCLCDCGNIKSFELRGFKALHYGSCGCYKPKIVEQCPQVKAVLQVKVFGQWTVLSWEEDKPRHLKCICTCGNTKNVRCDSLLNGDSTSCGCTAGERTGAKLKGRLKPDAQARHPLGSIYRGMRHRCGSEKSQDYKYYGGKGVKVCDRWLGEERGEGFENFVEDMFPTYSEGFEIERLDVNGDYSPENCKWVCRRSQLQNTTKSRRLTGWNIELTVSEWGFLLGFNPKMLDDRINKLKWDAPLEEVIGAVFKDRGYKLEYKGSICSASEIWVSEGFTEGQRNSRLTKYGDSLKALQAEGVDFKLVEERDKDYRTFEEGIEWLQSKQRDSFEDHLLYKIDKQLEEL